MTKETKCSQSCECNNKNKTHSQDSNHQSLQNNNPNQSEKEVKSTQLEEEKLSPTRFGDWEVGGRAIDF